MKVSIQRTIKAHPRIRACHIYHRKFSLVKPFNGDARFFQIYTRTERTSLSLVLLYVDMSAAKGMAPRIWLLKLFSDLLDWGGAAYLDNHQMSQHLEPQHWGMMLCRRDMSIGKLQWSQRIQCRW